MINAEPRDSNSSRSSAEPVLPRFGPGFLLGEMIMQNHINQRLIDPDATVVFNKAEHVKAIHEETDA
jgi:hypothetical protein